MPTIIQLKQTLRRYGLPVSGTKEVLARRLVEARSAERYKIIARAVLVKNHPAFALGAPLNDAKRAAIRKITDETEAALLIKGYEKRLKKNPALAINARRSVRKRQIAALLISEGKKHLAGRLPRFALWKEAGILRDYRAKVPVGHPLEADALALIHTLSPSIKTIVENEISKALTCDIKSVF